jgi:hypothetical protein
MHWQKPFALLFSQLMEKIQQENPGAGGDGGQAEENGNPYGH